MFTSVSGDTPGGQVRRITFVPFLPDGRCVLIDGARLPEGDVLAGEDYRLDTVLRVPLETAGFRYQRFQPCNAIDWMPPGDLRFDYVHVLLDCVPGSRRADLIRHHLAHTVRPGTGRLLVSHYANDPDAGNPPAPDVVRALGFPVAAQTSGGTVPGRPSIPTAIVTSPA